MDIPISEEQLIEWIHRIEGKTVVITGLYGSSHGAGKEIALLCAAKGANVVVADRDENTLIAVVAAVRAAGGHAEYKKTDVRHPEEVENLFKFVVSCYDQVDVVINIAGLGGEDNIQLSEQDKDIYNDPLIVGIKHATTTGLKYLESNTKSNLKSLVLVTTPGVNNARLKVVGTVKTLVPEYQDKGIKLGSVFPWFGDLTRVPPGLRARMGTPIRPTTSRIALAALFQATDPGHNGCLLILTDHAAVDMVEYGFVEDTTLQREIGGIKEEIAPGLGDTDADGHKSMSSLAKLIGNGGSNAEEPGQFVLPEKWQKSAQQTKVAMADMNAASRSVGAPTGFGTAPTTGPHAPQSGSAGSAPTQRESSSAMSATSANSGGAPAGSGTAATTSSGASPSSGSVGSAPTHRQMLRLTAMNAISAKSGSTPTGSGTAATTSSGAPQSSGSAGSAPSHRPMLFLAATGATSTKSGGAPAGSGTAATTSSGASPSSGSVGSAPTHRQMLRLAAMDAISAKSGSAPMGSGTAATTSSGAPQSSGSAGSAPSHRPMLLLASTGATSTKSGGAPAGSGTAATTSSSASRSSGSAGSAPMQTLRLIAMDANIAKPPGNAPVGTGTAATTSPGASLSSGSAGSAPTSRPMPLLTVMGAISANGGSAPVSSGIAATSSANAPQFSGSAAHTVPSLQVPFLKSPGFSRM